VSSEVLQKHRNEANQDLILASSERLERSKYILQNISSKDFYELLSIFSKNNVIEANWCIIRAPQETRPNSKTVRKYRRKKKRIFGGKSSVESGFLLQSSERSREEGSEEPRHLMFWLQSLDR
jgi:hypothetical protein